MSTPTKIIRKKFTAQEVATFLTLHNKWRRGGTGIRMQDPETIGIMLDNAVRHLKTIKP